MKVKYQLNKSDGKQVLIGNQGKPLITFSIDNSCNKSHILYNNSNIDKEFQWDYAEKNFGAAYDCYIECESKEELMICQSRFIELATNGFVSDSRKLIGMDWLDLERESFKVGFGKYFQRLILKEFSL